jgi:acyl carrier protein
LSDAEKDQIAEDIKQFLAEEFEMEAAEIRDEANIVNDLGGDSILFLEMIEEFNKKYSFNLEVRTIAQYMLKRQIATVGETIEAVCEIAEKGEELIASVQEGD